MIKLTKIAAGEYEFKGGSISKDEFETSLWWLRLDGHMVAEDFPSLKLARLFVTTFAKLEAN